MFVKQKSKIVENKEKCGENIRIIKTTQKKHKNLYNSSSDNRGYTVYFGHMTSILP